RAFYSHCAAPPPDRPPFPTRRSSDLPVRQIVGEIGRPEDFPPTGEDHLLRVEPILAPEVRTQRRTVPLQQGKERQEFGFKASNSSCTNSAIAVMVTRPSFRRTSFTLAICSASSSARSAGMK